MRPGATKRRNGKYPSNPRRALAAATRRGIPEVFVCASDATPRSLPALRQAIKLAASCGGSVVVVHVLEAVGPSAGWIGPTTPLEASRFQRAISRRLSTVKSRLERQIEQQTRWRKCAAVATVVESRSVVKGVLQAVEESDGSLVVVGRGSRPRALAPTADQLARLSRRPVLLVPVPPLRSAPARLIRFPLKRRRASAR
jgi:nucleotide-binding universal stress UspA family protein